jgi:plasmid stability protein
MASMTIRRLEDGVKVRLRCGPHATSPASTAAAFL